MTRYVALLRAINVGGRAKIRMTDLRDVFAAAGCRNVRSVIQSGNVLFESGSGDADSVMAGIRRSLETMIDQEPEILLRTTRDLERLVRESPFQGREAEPATKLYVAFLSRTPRRRPGF